MTTPSITTNRTPLFSGEPLDQIIALIMTLVIIQTAVVTYWFTLADDSNGDAGRDAQVFALQALATRTIGGIQANYDQTGAYQRWVELNTLANAAEQNGEDEAAKLYRAVQARLVKLSPLLQPPYFNPQTDVVPDLAAYEADRYLREATALGERFENQYRLKEAWFAKASAYTVQLILLAVTLFILGLAASTKRGMRRLMVAIGVGLALLTLVWMLVAYFLPVYSLPDQAITAYARGIGYLYQSDSPNAIREFDQAIQAAPTYTNAYRDRAYARYFAGDLQGTASDLEQTRANGDTSTETMSSLGFVNYSLGRFDAANVLHADAVRTSPNETWMRFNYALSLLASGQTPSAENQYHAALSQAARQVAEARTRGQEPSAGLWFEFDEGATDLESLAACATDQECDGAPPFESLKSPQDLARTANELAQRLKEYSVALEYTGKPPTGNVTATIEPFLFTRELEADEEQIHATDVFTATDEPVYVGITFSGLKDSQQIVVKVFVDGEEDDRLRVVADYSESEMGGSDGDVLLPITTGGIPLTPGIYRIEMYVDAKLVQTGSFEVREE